MQSEYSDNSCATSGPLPHLTSVLWLQGVTVIWMLIKCGVSLLAAARAHSPAMLAFGSHSLVELLSAGVVLLHFYLETWL